MFFELKPWVIIVTFPANEFKQDKNKRVIILFMYFILIVLFSIDFVIPSKVFPTCSAQTKVHWVVPKLPRIVQNPFYGHCSLQ